MKQGLFLFAFLWSMLAFANPGDYPNWAPETPKIPSRHGTAIACGPLEINDYGSHPEGQTSVTIYHAHMPTRSDLDYVYFNDFDSASAHQFSATYGDRCACVTYTWSDGPLWGSPGFGYSKAEPASALRPCPVAKRKRARR